MPTRELRSMDKHLLVVPDVRLALGRRSFSLAAPTIWKSLPLSLRSCTSLDSCCTSLDSFLSNLKIFLFPPEPTLSP